MEAPVYPPKVQAALLGFETGLRAADPVEDESARAQQPRVSIREIARELELDHLAGLMVGDFTGDARSWAESPA